jgi:hypothetical protein
MVEWTEYIPPKVEGRRLKIPVMWLRTRSERMKYMQMNAKKQKIYLSLLMFCNSLAYNIEMGPPSHKEAIGAQ